MVLGYFWFANFLVLIKTISSAKVIAVHGQVISRGAHSGVAFANFKSHKFAYLNISSLATTYVLNGNECGTACVNIMSCFSFNLATFFDVNGKILCELLPSDKYNNSDKFLASQSFHHYSIRSPCQSVLCLNNATCVSLYQNNSYLCLCKEGYKGKNCQTKKLGYFDSKPGHSCKQIRDSGANNKDGEYWIDPENNGNPFKAYCDMTNDGGGWLLVTNVLMQSSTPPSSWTAETSYRGISNYHNNLMGITTSAMNQLRTHLPFTQLRFHCSKQQGRTFHVTTTANSNGDAVIQYFSGQTDTLPFSCNSFQRMSDDNSQMAVQCDQWGNDQGLNYIGKWGHYLKQGGYRMYDHMAFIGGMNHWVIVNGHWLCDDGGSAGIHFAISSGDFWKIYVR